MRAEFVAMMTSLRRATRSDVPLLAALIEQSVRVLHRNSYSPAQIDLALANVYGVDTVLIDDGSYYLIEADVQIVACGGWSRRATLYGGDHFAGRTDDLLDPATDAAKIRAFFVHPEYVRGGLATRLLERCESDVMAAGFRRIELAATLAGVPFYADRGYLVVGSANVGLPTGESLPVVRMGRMLASPSSSALPHR